MTKAIPVTRPIDSGICGLSSGNHSDWIQRRRLGICARHCQGTRLAFTSPAGVPLLLMSSPNMPRLSVYSLTTGMKRTVTSKARTLVAAFICERGESG